MIIMCMQRIRGLKTPPTVRRVEWARPPDPVPWYHHINNIKLHRTTAADPFSTPALRQQAPRVPHKYLDLGR